MAGPRSTNERIADTVGRLENDIDAWVTSTNTERPWLAPLSFLWHDREASVRDGLHRAYRQERTGHPCSTCRAGSHQGRRDDPGSRSHFQLCGPYRGRGRGVSDQAWLGSPDLGRHCHSGPTCTDLGMARRERTFWTPPDDCRQVAPIAEHSVAGRCENRGMTADGPSTWSPPGCCGAVIVASCCIDRRRVVGIRIAGIFLAVTSRTVKTRPQRCVVSFVRSWALPPLLPENRLPKSGVRTSAWTFG